MAAAGVPVWLWESVLRDEDGSFNAAIVTSDPSATDPNAKSYGLFQLNSSGIGAGFSSSDLEDPTKNAHIAAQVMAGALSTLGPGANPVDQMRAIEAAGWPGNDPVLIAKEEPTRMALLYQTLQEEGMGAMADLVRGTLGIPGAGGSVVGGGAADPATAKFWGPLATQPDDFTSGPKAWPDLPAVLKGVERSSIVLGVGIALIAGGFALLRGSN
jgi:hypothetical protein